MRAVKVEKLVLNAHVGESGDRSVHAEKTSQQAERRIQSHTVSEVRKEVEQISIQMMIRSSAHCRKQSKSSGKGPSRR